MKKVILILLILASQNSIASFDCEASCGGLISISIDRGGIFTYNIVRRSKYISESVWSEAKSKAKAFRQLESKVHLAPRVRGRLFV